MTKILGLAALHRKLDRLPKVAKERIQAAMAAQADIIVALMKRLVSVDSGALRDSIGWTWGKAPADARVVSQVKAKLGGDLTITIYAGNDEAYYAAWQEFGTQDMPASPYFYVSWRASKKATRRAIGAAVRKAAREGSSA